MAEVLDFTKPHLLRDQGEYDIASPKSIPFSTQSRSPDRRSMSGWSFYLFWCRLMKTLISRLMSSPRPRKWLILCWSRRALPGRSGEVARR